MRKFISILLILVLITAIVIPVSAASFTIPLPFKYETFAIIFCIVCGCACAGLYLSFVLSDMNNVNQGCSANHYTSQNLVITDQRERFTHRTKTRHRIHDDNDSR